MPKLISARLHGRGKITYFDPGDFDLKPGMAAVVQTEQGLELAIFTGIVRDLEEDNPLVQDLPGLLRLATEEDCAQYEENLRLEKEALAICQEQIARHELPMKLVAAEYVLDRRRLIFYFTADGRVDFRLLVKDLAAAFCTRIELRQIGVRDEACLKGGLGMCGRCLCCASYMQDFYPVSIKMAKEQNLSMNPAKISGACGRLLCCLRYEEGAYADANKRLPKRGEVVDTPQGRGVVQDVNLLKETIKVYLESEGEGGEAWEFPAAELTRLKRKTGKREKHQERAKEREGKSSPQQDQD